MTGTLAKIGISANVSSGRADISCGQDRFFVSCDYAGHLPPITEDFLSFPAILLAIKNRSHVVVNGRVTQCCWKNTRELIDLYSTWLPDLVGTFDVSCAEVIEDAQARPTGKNAVQAVSGGIDSTYALITTQEKHALTHGLTIHGADYGVDETTAFAGLKQHTSRICEVAGIDLITVTTDFRRLIFNWGMGHMLNLAMVCHILGPEFRTAVVAADNTPVQDIIRCPHGNCAEISRRLGGGGLAIHYEGYDAIRLEKLRAIVEDGRYLEHISICNKERSSGQNQNCGKCPKCLQTRIALQLVGGSPDGLFSEYPDIVPALGKIQLKKRARAARGAVLRWGELYRNVPDGALKDALQRIYKEAIGLARLPQQIDKETRWERVCREWRSG